MSSYKTIVNALLIGFLFITIGCNKEKLTEATQEGAKTFSCKVDGNLYTAQIKSVSLSGAKPITVHNFRNDGFTLSTIDSRDGETFSTRMLLQLPYLQKTGSYRLGADPNYGVYEHNYSLGPYYKTGATYTGVINITRCDTVNRIYSGTFYFTAVDKNTGKVVKVTDGRFDVKQ